MNHALKEKGVLFAGSSHQGLAKEICQLTGMPLGRVSLSQFPDGEISVELLEEVRDKEVFVLQSIVEQPNHYLMELLIMIDALKRAFPKRITAVIPYLGYCRQDRKNKPGVPITAKLVANLLSAAGIQRLITLDLHAEQAEGFFEIPVGHLRCQELLCQAALDCVGEECVVLAPDIGSIKIGEAAAKFLGTELAVMKKNRLSASEVQMTLIGDVSKKHVLIIDDLCSTAGTLVAAAHLCKELGAQKVVAAATHGLFVQEALTRIEKSPIQSMWVTNTIPREESFCQSTKIKSLSVASLISKSL